MLIYMDKSEKKLSIFRLAMGQFIKKEEMLSQ